MTKELAELAFQAEKPKARSAPGEKLDQEVEVAICFCGPPKVGTEKQKAANAVAFAKLPEGVLGYEHLFQANKKAGLFARPLGDPRGNRTPASALRGRYPNR